MRAVRISEDFVPVSEFKAQASEWLRRLAESGAPLVVTQHGKPAGVLLSPEAFDELSERAAFESAVKAGLADVGAGRVVSDAEASRRIEARFRGRKK